MVYRQSSFNSKYRAVRQTYNGVNYDSKLEASRAYELDMLVKAGEIKGYDRQFKVDLYFYNKRGEQIPFKSWKVDFRVHNNDGSFTLEEVKGLELADFKMKRTICEKVWLEDNPDHDLVILKQANIRYRF